MAKPNTDEMLRRILPADVIANLEDLRAGFHADSLDETIRKATKIIHSEALESPGNALEFVRDGKRLPTMVISLNTDNVREAAAEQLIRQTSKGGPATVAGGPK